jgi:2',3'-cyclic-nucleotide 2'-phosphodiesterase (5'-nucleotidase family)
MQGWLKGTRHRGCYVIIAVLLPIIGFFFGGQLNLLKAADTELTIIYSNNSNGLLENCRCPEHAYGALEKRAALIDSLRRIMKNVLLLDCGDLLDIRKNKLQHSYVVQGYEIMKYDAWTCGDQDFMEGVDFFGQLLTNPKFPPVVCTNIMQNNRPLGQKYLIKNYDNLRIGICGTINPDFRNYLEQPAKQFYQFTEQQSALQTVLSGMVSRCDFILLLSHSGYEQDKKIAAWFPMINVIIGGHSQTLLEKPDILGNTYIVQAGENGYRLGVLHLRFAGKQLLAVENKLILLDDRINNSPAVMELIKSYHQQVKAKKQ